MHFASCFGARMGFTVLSGSPLCSRCGLVLWISLLTSPNSGGRNSWGGFEVSKRDFWVYFFLLVLLFLRSNLFFPRCPATRATFDTRDKERGLPPDRIIRGQAAAERHRLDHPGWIKQHVPPHPGLDHPGTKGDQTPQTGKSGVEQAVGATAPTTRKTRDTW